MKRRVTLNHSLDDLMYHRIVVEASCRRVVIDLLCYSSDKAQVLVEYFIGRGEARTVWMSKQKINSWIERISRFSSYIM